MKELTPCDCDRLLVMWVTIRLPAIWPFPALLIVITDQASETPIAPLRTLGIIPLQLNYVITVEHSEILCHNNFQHSTH